MRHSRTTLTWYGCTVHGVDAMHSADEPCEVPPGPTRSPCRSGRRAALRTAGPGRAGLAGDRAAHECCPGRRARPGRTWHDAGVVAVLSVSLCGVLALTAYTDPVAVAAGVAVAQLVLAGAVFQGPAVPAPRTASVVIALGGLTAAALAAWPDALTGFEGSQAGDSARMSGGTLMGLAPAAGLVVLGAIVREMLRRGRRSGLTASVATTVSLGVLGVLLASWVGASRTDAGDQIVLLGAAAVAVAVVVWSLPGPRWAIGPLAVVAGAAATFGVGSVLDDALELPVVVGFGAAAALLAGCGRAIAAHLVADPARRLSVDAVLPLVLAGPIAFWTGQIFG